MRDSPKFLLICTNTGEWILLPRERDQDRELAAITIAAFEFEGADHEGVVHLEAAPALASGNSRSAGFNHHLIEAWLYYLGRIGEISLYPGARSASPQTIGRRFALPPDLIKSQSGSIEKAVLNVRGIRSPADLVRLAPKTSVAGIAARIGRESELLALMRLQTADRWMDLVTPLCLPPTPHSGGEQAFAIALIAPASGYLWLPGAVVMEHCHVRVSRDGSIAIEVLPIDAFGFGSDSPVQGPRDDYEGSYRALLDGSAISALQRFPDTAKRILTDILSSLPTGAYSDLVDTDVSAPLGLPAWMEEINATLQEDLFAIEQCLRWKVYPFDGESRPVQVSQWLHAGNDEERQARRRQALCALPHPVTALVVENDPDILSAIDEARPLIEAIQDRYSAPKWAVRRTIGHLSACSPERPSGGTFHNASAFRNTLKRTLALGQAAPPLPSRHVSSVQRLIDWFCWDHGNFEPPDSVERRILRALGLSASRTGWDAATGLVLPILRHRLCLTLLERIASATVSTHLDSMGKDSSSRTPSASSITDAWLGELDANDWVRRGKALAALHWNATEPELIHALQVAVRESGPRVRSSTEGSEDSAQRARHLLWPQSFTATRTSIYPLISKQALLEEAERMSNCLSTYWIHVRRFEQLIVVLEEEGSGMRADAALELQEDGSWTVRQIRAANDARIPRESTIRRTVDELAEWLTSHPDELDQVTLQFFMTRWAELRKPVNIEAFDALAVQRLPEPLAEQVLACLPGAGDVEKRISHAIKLAEKFATKSGQLECSCSCRS